MKLFLLIWFLIGVAVLPFIFLSYAAVGLEKIQKYLDARNKLFKDINHLISIMKQEDSSEEDIEEALEAFRKHFLAFEDLAKDSQPYQDRLNFISALSSRESISIDDVINYREEFVRANPSLKKEISTVVNIIVKKREKEARKRQNYSYESVDGLSGVNIKTKAD
ncbi:MAG: hypothetical protein J1E31_03815 [Helicobacter sp.]|nr:hypothetical protein [Helicobacter sp.]